MRILSPRLLWLSPRAWGEHLTCLLIWVAALLLVACVCPVYLDELALCVAGVIEGRMLCWCKSRVTQEVVSFPTDLLHVGWQVMVNSADGDWFLCYSGYFLLQVMVVGLEKKMSCTASGRWNVSRGHFKTCSWVSVHSKIKKLT